MVSDLKAKEFCFMQKKSSRPSCFKAAMALFFAVVFFISGCSVGSGTEPSCNTYTGADYASSDHTGT